MSEIRNNDGLTEKEFLEQYKPGDYERPSITVDMLLFTVDKKPVNNVRSDNESELKILLIKRKDHPFIHKWALPGGFVGINENISDAAKRELKEETNISNVYMEQLFTFGDVERDPRMRVISASHMALIPKSSVNPIAGDDAEDVAWFSVSKTLTKVKSDRELLYKLTISNEELKINESYIVDETIKMNGKVPIKDTIVTNIDENNILAFDHIKQINMAINRLRNKVEYTPIAFNLLEDRFTLNEVQSLYELLLGKKLVKQNFRVKIAKFVSPVEEMQVNVGHRPAKLYKLKELNIDEIG